MTDTAAQHADLAQLEAGLRRLERAPADTGTVEMVVARPEPGSREVLDAGVLSPEGGLHGDRWFETQRHVDDQGVVAKDNQLTLMSSRWLDVLTDGDRDRWKLAGDQVIVDFDLSHDNLQAGDRLALGTAVVQVTPKPHTGCKTFVEHFGVEAQRMGASDRGRHLRLRGIYVRIVNGGEVARGDRIAKLQD